MQYELKSIFKDEMNLHLTLRKEELSPEAYRHYKHTVMLFDEYLHSINLSLTGWKLIDYANQQHEIKDYQRFLHFRSMHRIEILMQHPFLEVL